MHAANFGAPQLAPISFGLAGAYPAAILIRLGLNPSDAYTAMFALWLSVAVLGALSYGLARVGIPLTPIILGLVLGPSIEREFRTAMILSDNNLNIFYTSIPAAFFIGLSVLIVGLQVVRSMRGSLKPSTTETESDASVQPK